MTNRKSNIDNHEQATSFKHEVQEAEGIREPELKPTPVEERESIPKHFIKEFIDDFGLSRDKNPIFYRLIKHIIKYFVFWFALFWFVTFLGDMGLKHVRSIFCQLGSESHCEEVVEKIKEEVKKEVVEEKKENIEKDKEDIKDEIESDESESPLGEKASEEDVPLRIPR